MAILPIKSIIQQSSATTPIQSCEEKASMKMATMRFSSAQGANDYRKQLIEECMGMSQQPTTTVSNSPTATGTVTNTVSTNLAPAPVKTGVSAIVEPDFANVKVYDLDAPSGSPSGTSGSGSSAQEISENNVQNTSSVVAVAKKPNYVLYGGIAVSAILLYKILK